ncbi:MAG: NrdH-redoxin [Chloroflexi bacterium]|nr:NrdH-redoxin [Chloroflexota bacterium]
MRRDGITVYGTTWCGDCHRARRVLDQYGTPYTWVGIDADPQAQATVLRLNGGLRSVPTVVFPDGSVLVEPSNRAHADRLKEGVA